MIYAMRVIAGPRGRCRVESGGETTSLQALAAEGGVYDLVEGERRHRALLYADRRGQFGCATAAGHGIS